MYWIADTDRPKPSSAEVDASITPEGPVDIVWRLLMAAQTVHEAEGDLSSRMITRTGRGKKPRGAVYIDYHREERSKSWRDKLRSWTRYIDAVAKPDERKLQPLQLATRVELAQLPPPSMPDAATKVSDVTVATFGHVLHPPDAAKGSSTKTADKSRRILSPVIPHPAALTTLSAGDEPVTQSTAIILNFSPDTTQQAGTAADGTGLPRVRLTLPVDETTDLSNFDFPPHSTLHAVTTQRIQDLLLPTESVDVRLTQQQLASLATDQPALKQFLAASEFDLLEGRLRTPSRIAFALPGADTDADVPYLFMGLEVHQAVETRLAGHAIRYESIEAGQHGGQRQQLSLHRARRAYGSTGDGDGFLQLVEDVAAGNVFSWNDGPALMQQRSSELFTMDMVEDGAVDGEQALDADEIPPLQEHDAVPKAEDELAEPVQEQDDARDEAVKAEEQDVVSKEEDELVEQVHEQDDARDDAVEPAAQATDPSKDEPAMEETTDAESHSLLEESTADASDSTAADSTGEEQPRGEAAPVSGNDDASSEKKL